MASISFPAEQDIRNALIRRAEEFSRRTGMSKSEISKRAVKDGAFISQVAAGRNFTVRLYQRMMDWLDANWPDPEPADRKREQSTSNRRRRDDNRPATGHFSRFRHLRTSHFRTAAEIEEHVDRLRDEWSHR